MPNTDRNKEPMINVKVHRRILRFLNAARRPDDLLQRPRRDIPLHDDRMMEGVHEDESVKESKRIPLLDKELAKRVLQEKEKISPIYGFRHLRQVLEIKGLDAVFAHLTTAFSAAVYGEWETVYDGLVPDRTPTRAYHAALLHTGRVLFLPNAYGTDTTLWNPDDADPATAFELLNAATTGLGNSLVCSGHSFLSDGKLLAAGGSASPTSNRGWKFDPVAKTWVQTAGNMVSARWYPTLVTLGDDSGRVLVVDGSLSNGAAAVTAVEIYSESSDSFVRVFGPLGGPGDTSADRGFSWLYPGLHLLPNGQIFHTKVGDRHVGSDETALFSFSALEQGAWTNLTGAASGPDRYKGMSALLLRKVAADPDRIVVVGGGDAATQPTIGIIESPPTVASTWLTGTLPDSLPRNDVHVVVLPDSTVFICGGRPPDIPATAAGGGACWIYNPAGGVGAGAFSEMDELEYERRHHAVALLLPSAKVMVTGGGADAGLPAGVDRIIEVFSPPYLFNADGSLATRPDITSFPDPDAGQIVLHGSTFEVGTANPGDITNVVLVRPMAVTHSTDTEQRVIQLSFTPGATTLSVTAPDARVYPYGASGGHTHAIAGRGYYMLFILNSAGVPSRAKFIRLV